MNHKKKLSLRHPLPTFGSFSFFQASIWLRVDKVLQKLTKLYENELRHFFQCCVLIPRKCPCKTSFQHTVAGGSIVYSVLLLLGWVTCGLDYYSHRTFWFLDCLPGHCVWTVLYYYTGFFADFGDKISSVLGGISLLNLVEFSILLLPGLCAGCLELESTFLKSTFLNILVLLLLNHSFSSLYWFWWIPDNALLTAIL